MSLKIAIFSLNQWALDFTGNTKRIIDSITLASEAGAGYRAGPELELCGYSIEDAFYEQDTIYHSWECLLSIVEHCRNLNMIVDIGMPVQNIALYNCRVLIFQGKILCIRAKTSLAREGNYREHRHFTPWNIKAGLTAYKLPQFVTEKLGQDFVPFGANFILELVQPNECNTLKIGWDICQELWDAKNVSADLYQRLGCHLVINGSGSYWELRKLNVVLDMVKGISLRGGACYAFSNFIGCDGQRYVFYGRSCIYDKGDLVAMTPISTDIFSEVQMITHVVRTRDINEYRSQQGFQPEQSHPVGRVWRLDSTQDVSRIDSSYNRLMLEVNFGVKSLDVLDECLPISDNIIRFEHEIHLYVSLWLWDYLRRSKAIGFMMPLSGGLDSSTVAMLVYAMCNYIFANLNQETVINYFVNTHKLNPIQIKKELNSPEAICRKILKCSYLSTKYSSKETTSRAEYLCKVIGAEYINLSIQDVYSSFRTTLGAEGSDVSLLDQNLQARLRMTATYYLSGGNRLVLATGNVDEAIMGYLTKYDCSSADINPIGGLCKNDLKSYMLYCCSNLYSGNKNLVRIIEDIVKAPPSAELTGSEQRDEDEIGITYDEISVLGRVRRGVYGSSGPRGAFETVWQNRRKKPFTDKIRCLRQSDKELGQMASELAELIKRFYDRYAKNRHKLTVLTPSLHAETYSPDDNRFDHRHFLYAPWIEQFKAIDKLVENIK